jgi:hypothetical protein
LRPCHATFVSCYRSRDAVHAGLCYQYHESQTCRTGSRRTQHMVSRSEVARSHKQWLLRSRSSAFIYQAPQPGPRASASYCIISSKVQTSDIVCCTLVLRSTFPRPRERKRSLLRFSSSSHCCPTTIFFVAMVSESAGEQFVCPSDKGFWLCSR